MGRRARVLALIAACPLVVGTLAGLATPASAQVPSQAANCTDVLVAAHRGMHDATHTENTIRSGRQAAKNGVPVVEGDMQLTRDGVWVMMHDATVDRTTNGTGRVSALRLTQVRALRTNDGYAGGVPTVDSLLTVLDAYPTLRLQLEIKPGTVSSTALRALLATFTKHHLGDRLLITSFNTAPLSAVRAAGSSWRTALISGSRIATTTATRYGQAVVVEQAAITAAYVDQVHAAGLTVYAWTVDSEAAWLRLVNLGVDGIITNQSRAAMGWCAA